MCQFSFLTFKVKPIHEYLFLNTLKGYYENYIKKTVNNFAKFKIEGSKICNRFNSTFFDSKWNQQNPENWNKFPSQRLIIDWEKIFWFLFKVK